MLGSEVVCKTQGGTVEPGKKGTVTFHFTPTSLELVESFWMFTIPGLGLCVPLLVVGQTKEPRVVIDRSQVSHSQIINSFDPQALPSRDLSLVAGDS